MTALQTVLAGKLRHASVPDRATTLLRQAGTYIDHP